jgi:hypothetical protein
LDQLKACRETFDRFGLELFYLMPDHAKYSRAVLTALSTLENVLDALTEDELTAFGLREHDWVALSSLLTNLEGNTP